MTLKSLFTIILFTAFAFNISFCTFKVISPPSVKNKDIKYQFTPYGNIPYGSSLTGTLVLADPEDACSGFSVSGFNLDQNIQVPIFIARRGGCKYVVKTMYAQLAGAKLFIIVQDNDDKIDVSTIGVDTPTDITIPTIILKKTDGDKLINAIKSAQKGGTASKDSYVVAKLEFPASALTQTASMDFWFSPADSVDVVYKFLKELKPLVIEAKHEIEFRPHYVTWYCGYCKNANYTVNDPDCLSGGRYCSPDPDDEGPLSGSNVVYEDIRQICILQSFAYKWWDYIVHFDTCVNSPKQEECVEEMMTKKAGFSSDDLNKVKKCMRESFRSEVQGREVNIKLDDNTLLSWERYLQNSHDISSFPVLKINQRTYQGKLDNATHIFKLVCQTLTKPSEFCQKYINDHVEPPLSKITIFNFVLLMLVLVIIILFCYRRMQRREMAKEMSIQVNQMVSQYFALNESRRTQEI